MSSRWPSRGEQGGRCAQANAARYLYSQATLPLPPSFMHPFHTHTLTPLCFHRLEAWPEEGTPEAVSSGIFDIGHARAVQLLGRLALSTGGDLKATLAPRLAEMMTQERLQVPVVCACACIKSALHLKVFGGHPSPPENAFH